MDVLAETKSFKLCYWGKIFYFTVQAEYLIYTFCPRYYVNHPLTATRCGTLLTVTTHWHLPPVDLWSHCRPLGSGSSVSSSAQEHWLHSLHLPSLASTSGQHWPLTTMTTRFTTLTTENTIYNTHHIYNAAWHHTHFC